MKTYILLLLLLSVLYSCNENLLLPGEERLPSSEILPYLIVGDPQASISRLNIDIKTPIQYGQSPGFYLDLNGDGSGDFVIHANTSFCNEWFDDGYTEMWKIYSCNPSSKILSDTLLSSGIMLFLEARTLDLGQLVTCDDCWNSCARMPEEFDFPLGYPLSHKNSGFELFLNPCNWTPRPQPGDSKGSYSDAGSGPDQKIIGLMVETETAITLGWLKICQSSYNTMRIEETGSVDFPKSNHDLVNRCK